MTMKTLPKPKPDGKPSARRKTFSKQLAIVRSMPALKHWPNKPQPFDPRESEVCRWLTQQPGVLNRFFSEVRDRGLILFDQKTRTWHGVDNVGATPERTEAAAAPAPANSQSEPMTRLLEKLDDISGLLDGIACYMQSIKGRMP